MALGFHATSSARRLTLRSSGPPTALRLARSLPQVIVHPAGQAKRRLRPLSSNVRPHNQHLFTASVSTEIYVSRFRFGQPEKFVASELAASFAGLMAESDSERLVLNLGDNESVFITLGTGGSSTGTNSFTVFRPVEDARLYQALFRVLQTAGTVAYAPGSPPVVATAESKGHLPQDMCAALGVTVEASSASALREALFGRS